MVSNIMQTVTILEALEKAQEMSYEWAHIQTRTSKHFIMIEKLISKIKTDKYKRLAYQKKSFFDTRNGMISINDDSFIFLHPYKSNINYE